LHSTVVTASNDAAAVHEHGTDGNAALARSGFRFGDGCKQELVRQTLSPPGATRRSDRCVSLATLA